MRVIKNYKSQITNFHDINLIECDKIYRIHHKCLARLIRILDRKNAYVIKYDGSLLDEYLIYIDFMHTGFLIREKYVNCWESEYTLEITRNIEKVKDFFKSRYDRIRFGAYDVLDKYDLNELYSFLNTNSSFKNWLVARG